MAKPHGTDQNGQPVDLIGQPLIEGKGSVPGVLIEAERRPYMAEKRTFERYRYGDTVIRVFAGDDVPEGAVKVEVKEERAQQAAPENKARKAAPQAKSKD